ncbi:MAG: BREX system ATP-binding domain-containing protein [Pseudomonadota bacterium]
MTPAVTPVEPRVEPGIEPHLARAILARVGEIGQPPDLGIEYLNAGNESILGVLEHEYIAPMAEARRGSSFKLVQAYFGGGKTHFLYAVRSLAWRYGFASAVVGLSPEECPFDDPVRIYRAVAAEISWPPQGSGSLPARGIEAALRVALEERVEQAGAEAVEAWINTELRRTSLDSPSFRAAVVGYLRALLCGEPAQEDLLGAFLRGDDLSLAELRPLGVREQLSRESGFRFLRSLCQAVQSLGCPGLLLCFDELDRNLSLPPRRRRAVADNLRQLIDLTGREALPGLLCLYAVPPEFMRNVVVEYPALQQRLEGPSMLSARSPQAAVIDLERLDLEPQALLVAIGLRLLALFEAAHASGFDLDLQQQNLDVLAGEVLASSFEVAHRRAFVKAAVELLHSQAVEEGPLSPAEARRLAGQGGEIVPLGAADGFEVF